MAFAIGRALGPAVTRNRLRRRLRAILRLLDHEQPLPAATLLIGANQRVNELTFDQLIEETRTLIDQVRVVCKP